MKKILEFQSPEDEELYQDYEEGVKLLHIMHQWLQVTRRELDHKELTGEEVFESLNNAIEDVRIFR